MAWTQGAESIFNVIASSSGTGVAFTNDPHYVHVANAGTSNIYISFATTSGTTDGFVIRPSTDKIFHSIKGKFVTASVMTTVAGSSAAVSIIGLE